MASIQVAGVEIGYELLGPVRAQAVAITPGGRFPKDTPGIRELATALADGGRRVLIWDRPNSGESGLCLDGASESAMQGEILIALIKALDLGPTALAGGSAGSRASLLAAAHAPAAVSHLVQWWVSGGRLSLMSLGSAYCCDPAVAASMGGMPAVIGLPMWAAYLDRNAEAREQLMAVAPETFIERMDQWAQAFVPSPESPVPGMAAGDFSRLTMPTLIFRGSTRDLYHPAWMCDRLAELLPAAQLQDPPWSDEEFLANQVEAGRTGIGHFRHWPRLASAILEFTARA